MPVQIPRGVQRAQSQANDSIGRVELNVKDDGYGQALGAVTKLAQSGVDVVKKYNTAKKEQIAAEDKVYDIKAKAGAVKVRDNVQNAYHTLTQGAIDGSDYSERYADFENQLAKNTEDAVNAAGGSTEDKERLRGFIYSEMDSSTREAQRAFFVRNQAMQIKTTEASNKNATSDMMLSAVDIDPKDPTSFEAFDKNLNKISDNLKALAQYSGATTKGEDGQPIYSDSMLAASNKAEAQALSQSIEKMLAIGQTKKARAIYDRHRDKLTLDKDAKEFDKLFTKADKEEKIDSVINKLKKLPENVGIQAINLSTAIPQEHKVDAIERLEKVKKNQRAFVDRTSDEARQIMIAQLAKDPKRLQMTEQQLMDSPTYSTGFKRLKRQEDRQAVLNYIGSRSKVGDSKQLENLTDSYRSGQMKTWSDDDFNKNTNGMSDKQFKIAESYFKSSKGLVTGGPPAELKTKISSRALQVIELTGNGIYEYKESSAGNRSLSDRDKRRKVEEIIPFVEEEISKLPAASLDAKEMATAVESIRKKTLEKFKPKAQPKKRERSFFERLNPFGGNDESLTDSSEKSNIKKNYDL